ncbi:cellulose synthase-like protein E1 [Prunus yedoensis var. nudiflora]|uniref:Cellulose synthase-like protein E1 n=1 Tax=Prunus yedoensis var. nudiflora TaxID=2094558 RepID=A0A314Z9L8_PRUYE|nr:cellulose synthase-like protein E1 [Prunus yedoensis var. nudiflora]
MLWMEIGVLQPNKKSFIRIALVQHKRLSEGSLQILLSKYSPAWYGHGKISLALQLGYCIVCCWATLFYSIVPSLYLLKGISLFPQISSPWLIPFALCDHWQVYLELCGLMAQS